MAEVQQLIRHDARLCKGKQRWLSEHRLHSTNREETPDFFDGAMPLTSAVLRDSITACPLHSHFPLRMINGQRRSFTRQENSMNTRDTCLTLMIVIACSTSASYAASISGTIKGPDRGSS